MWGPAPCPRVPWAPTASPSIRAPRAASAAPRVRTPRREPVRRASPRGHLEPPLTGLPAEPPLTRTPTETSSAATAAGRDRLRQRGRGPGGGARLGRGRAQRPGGRGPVTAGVMPSQRSCAAPGGHAHRRRGAAAAVRTPGAPGPGRAARRRGRTRPLLVDVNFPGAVTPRRVLRRARRPAHGHELLARYESGLTWAAGELLAGRLDVSFGRFAGLAPALRTGLEQQPVRYEPMAVLLPEEHGPGRPGPGCRSPPRPERRCTPGRAIRVRRSGPTWRGCCSRGGTNRSGAARAAGAGRRGVPADHGRDALPDPGGGGLSAAAGNRAAAARGPGSAVPCVACMEKRADSPGFGRPSTGGERAGPHGGVVGRVASGHGSCRHGVPVMSHN